MKLKKIISVVGARPNFMKVAPIHKEMLRYKPAITHLICHTGQHYDKKMSSVFFEELGLPQPDFYLGVGSGSHAVQTAAVMVEFEKVVNSEKPDLVIVVGDVNSTIACTLVAKKMNIPVAHVEAGLRSFDREMPEEINRIVTDVLADYLFITEKSAQVNLANEGIPSSRVFFCGNVMIDSLVTHLPEVLRSQVRSGLGIENSPYLLVTLHRPSNVDFESSLSDILKLLSKYATGRKLVFPVHPRTREKIRVFGLEHLLNENIILAEPFGYLEFIHLIKHAELVITDSGGIQEETTFLNVPCVTLRNNTERPVTVEEGTNFLVGTRISDADHVINSILSGNRKQGKIPEFWDGKAAERICKIITDIELPASTS